MNIIDTAHAVAHEYDGGCESLAPRMGISAQVLRNKVNPNISTHHLTLAESVRMTALTGDERILETWAEELSCVLVKLPAADLDCDNEELLSKFTQILGDLGELASTHREAIKDGVVNDRERHDLEHVAATAHRHIQELLTLTFRIYCPSGKREG